MGSCPYFSVVGLCRIYQQLQPGSAAPFLLGPLDGLYTNQSIPVSRFRLYVWMVMSFLDEGGFPFGGYPPNIWWPEDWAWCVATDINLYDTYVGGSEECIEAVLDYADLEVLPTSLDALVDMGGDTVNG